jgi:hypothetical protein
MVVEGSRASKFAGSKWCLIQSCVKLQDSLCGLHEDLDQMRAPIGGAQRVWRDFVAETLKVGCDSAHLRSSGIVPQSPPKCVVCLAPKV